MFEKIEGPKPDREPLKVASTVSIPGAPADAIVSMGLIVICWFALPLARPFILGSGAPG